MLVVSRDELIERTGGVARFDGRDHGGVRFSFFLAEPGPGQGPRLHRHEYEEVFVVQDGAVTVTAGEETVVVSAGEVAVVPPRTPHRFVNHTAERARLTNIHYSPEVVTEWLE